MACGKDSNVSNTQSAFPISTHASILGFPPVDSTSSAPVTAPATFQHSITAATHVTLVSANPVTLFSTMAVASATASGPSQHSNQATQQATAIGAGIGLPLGVAAIGFVVLLFWRETRGNINKQQRQQHPYSGNGDAQRGSPVASKATPRLGAELPDSQIPWELDHRAGIVEIPALSAS